MKKHFSPFALSAAALFACMQSASAQTAWTWQNPLPHGNTLRDVEFVDRSTGIIVGDVGTIMRTIDDGETWSLIEADTKADLYGVSFPTPDTGFIAGNTFLRTEDGGKTWSVKTKGGGRGISFPSTMRGYTFSNYPGNWEYPPVGLIWRTKDGGDTWSSHRGGYRVAAIFFINENIGTYVDGYITHRTIDGGDNWSNTVVKGEPTPFFNGLHFADADTGWAVGNRGDIFRTTDGGLAWTKMISPTAEHLQSVFFCDSKLGNAVGNHGTILRTADGGITWTQCESGTTLDLLNVWFADANTGIAVGTGGVILRTSDGGATWKNFLRAVTLQTLLSAHFHNAAIGTAIGKAGTILRTTDGGKSWLPQNSGTPHDLLGLAFIQSDTGFVVGKAGVILRTDDGGATWMKQTSGVSNNLNSVWLDRANVATAVGDSGVILRTLNGGASWEKQVSGTTNRLLCVSFSNLDTGIVVSTAGEIVHTNNGGRSWIKLSASPFPKIDAAYFADANNGILASSWIGSYGVPYAGIWTTANGGMTWKQWISISAFLPKTVSLSLYGEGVVVGDDGVISRKSAAETNWRTETRGTSNDLYGVAFIDSNHIVVVGEYGTIMQAKSNGVVSVREHGFLENVSPREPALLQNYPNPFNPSTTIEFFLPRASFVTLRIFDTLGQEVAVLISQFRSQGKQSVIWQTKELASGIYLCRLETKDRVQSRKLLLLR